MPIVPTPPQHPPRDIVEVRRLIERYPPSFRRWCDVETRGPCACMGCLRWPAPKDVSGRDPEGQPFPDPSKQLTREEVALYFASGQAGGNDGG